MCGHAETTAVRVTSGSRVCVIGLQRDTLPSWTAGPKSIDPTVPCLYDVDSLRRSGLRGVPTVRCSDVLYLPILRLVHLLVVQAMCLCVWCGQQAILPCLTARGHPEKSIALVGVPSSFVGCSCIVWPHTCVACLGLLLETS